MIQFYEALVDDHAPDANRPGHLSLVIPEVGGKEPIPVLIPPLFPGASGGWRSVPAAEDQAGEQARVIVVRLGRDSFRWIGTSQDWDVVSTSGGKICGARSGDGKHYILLDDDAGVTVVADGLGMKIALQAPMIELNGSTDAFIKSQSFLTDLQSVLTEIVTIAATVPTAAPQATLMAAQVAASLSAGAPYLSTSVKGT